jgi:predicted CopG family antitoxin
MLLRMKSRMIQIRHVPEDVHRRLKERAKREGMSLSDYLLQEVTLLSRQMSWEELFDEIDETDPTPTGIDWAEAVREGREERDRELMDGFLQRDAEP